MEGKTLNVFLVEPDGATAERLARRVSDLGHRVSVFRNGEKAIDSFVESPADVVLVHYYLPGRNGASTIEAMRWAPRGRELAAVLYAQEEPEEASLASIGMRVDASYSWVGPLDAPFVEEAFAADRFARAAGAPSLPTIDAGGIDSTTMLLVPGPKASLIDGPRPVVALSMARPGAPLAATVERSLDDDELAALEASVDGSRWREVPTQGAAFVRDLTPDRAWSPRPTPKPAANDPPAIDEDDDELTPAPREASGLRAGVPDEPGRRDTDEPRRATPLPEPAERLEPPRLGAVWRAPAPSSVERDLTFDGHDDGGFDPLPLGAAFDDLGVGVEDDLERPTDRPPPFHGDDEPLGSEDTGPGIDPDEPLDLEGALDDDLGRRETMPPVAHDPRIESDVPHERPTEPPGHDGAPSDVARVAFPPPPRMPSESMRAWAPQAESMDDQPIDDQPIDDQPMPEAASEGVAEPAPVIAPAPPSEEIAAERITAPGPRGRRGATAVLPRGDVEASGDAPKPRQIAKVARPRLTDPLGERESADVRSEVERSQRAKPELEGSFETNTFPRVLLRIAAERWSGMLIARDEGLQRATVSPEPPTKILFVREGTPVHVRSNLVDECLGQFLLRTKRIDLRTLESSIRQMRREGGLQGQILIEMGVLTPEKLEQALREQSRQKVLDLFAWRRGSFRFTRRDDLPSATDFGALTDLIHEGIRTAMPSTLLLDLLTPSLDLYVVPHAERLAEFGEARVEDGLAPVFSRLDGTLRLREVLRLSQKPGSVAQLVYTLLCLEAVRLDPRRQSVAFGATVPAYDLSIEQPLTTDDLAAARRAPSTRPEPDRRSTPFVHERDDESHGLVSTAPSHGATAGAPGVEPPRTSDADDEARPDAGAERRDAAAERRDDSPPTTDGIEVPDESAVAARPTPPRASERPRFVDDQASHVIDRARGENSGARRVEDDRDATGGGEDEVEVEGASDAETGPPLRRAPSTAPPPRAEVPLDVTADQPLDDVLDAASSLEAPLPPLADDVRPTYESAPPPATHPSDPPKAGAALAAPSSEERRALDVHLDRLFEAERHFRRGNRLLEKKIYPDAIAAFRRAVELCPDEGEFLAYLGWARYCSSATQTSREGESDLRDAIAKAPDLHIAHLLLARVLEREQRRDEALASYGVVMTIEPNNGEAQQAIARLRAEAER